MRLIHCSRYLAHTDPLFKARRILKIEDMYILSHLKFYHRLVNYCLPDYFYKMNLPRNSDMHDHDTRHRLDFRTPLRGHKFGENILCKRLPLIINDMSDFILPYIDKPINSLVTAFKNICIDSYSDDQCTDPDCFPCMYDERSQMGF